MKLAEALILRVDYQVKVEHLKKRILSNVKVQEGEEPTEKPVELLKDLDLTLNKLSDLIIRINKTNSCTMVDSSKTIADALAERDRIFTKRSILDKIIDESAIMQPRYSGSEIKFVRMLDIVMLQKEMDKLSKEFRELDTKIQEKNWLTELVE